MPLPVSPEAATAIERDSIPVHVRTFVSTLLGAKKPITQNDLSLQEQLRLRKMIENQRQVEVHSTDGALDGPPTYRKANHGSLNTYNTDDAALKYLLGTSKYTANSDGSLDVLDSYDWDYGDQGRAKEKAQQPVMSRLHDVLANSYRVLRGSQPLGKKVLDIADDVGANFITGKRPVNIHLAKNK